MIGMLVVVLLLVGLSMCLLQRWVGFLLAMLTVMLGAWLYGYPTPAVSLLPDEFHLLATHKRAIWIETDRGPRAFTIDPVPPSWLEALEQNNGQPVRMKRRKDEDHVSGLFTSDVERQFEVIDEYQMQKGPRQ